MLVPHFLAVPNIIANTDLLCVVPRQLGQVYSDFGQVRIVSLPVKGVFFKVSQFWYKRFDTDQGSIWLRENHSRTIPARVIRASQSGHGSITARAGYFEAFTFLATTIAPTIFRLCVRSNGAGTLSVKFVITCPLGTLAKIP